VNDEERICSRRREGRVCNGAGKGDYACGNPEWGCGREKVPVVKALCKGEWMVKDLENLRHGSSSLFSTRAGGKKKLETVHWKG